MPDSKFVMEYRLLGDTGLKVSVLGLGGMTYDTVDKTVELMRCVRNYGVNFFDNAEGYGNPIRGMSEINFGKALKRLQLEDKKLWRRSELVITTKIYFGCQSGGKQEPNSKSYGPNEFGLTRKHLFEGTKDALNRMKLDYVDIIYAHRPDNLTSIEQIVKSFNYIIKQGYAFHWGTSMWKPIQLVEAHYIAKSLGLEGPVVEQPKYSMFDRQIMEYSYLDLFSSPFNLSTTIWNILDRGILSGKYNKSMPLNSRLSGNNHLGAFVGHSKHVTKDKVNKVDKLINIANELGITMSQLAIGWLIKNNNVTVCILGATKLYQLEDSMGSIKAANLITDDIIKRIEKILNNKPQPQEIDFQLRKDERIVSRL